MKVVTPGRVSLSHLMWEPRGQCSRGCTGCYAAFSPARNYKGAPTLDLLEGILSKNIEAGQFTLALNDVFMKNLPVTLIEALQDIWKNPLLYPALCVTVHTWESAKAWAEGILGLSIEEFLEPLYMLSLSELPVFPKAPIRGAIEKSHTILNYNCLVDVPKNPTEADLAPKDLSIASGLVDQIYLIYQKSPLGMEQNLNALIRWSRTLIASRDSSLKIIPDACIVESFGHRFFGTACGAGIQKAQVWADGGVTGCPYDSKRVTRTEPSVKSIMDELDEATNNIIDLSSSPLSKCRIPDLLDSLGEINPDLFMSVMRTVSFRSENV